LISLPTYEEHPTIPPTLLPVSTCENNNKLFAGGKISRKHTPLTSALDEMKNSVYDFSERSFSAFFL
jgi:hypothetical protein